MHSWEHIFLEIRNKLKDEYSKVTLNCEAPKILLLMTITGWRLRKISRITSDLFLYWRFKFPKAFTKK